MAEAGGGSTFVLRAGKDWLAARNIASQKGEMPTLLLRLLALLVAAAVPTLPSQLNDPNTTEGWIWQRAQKGSVADLSDKCPTAAPDIHKPDDAGWRDRSPRHERPSCPIERHRGRRDTARQG
jgi:hypothetical protein